MRGKNTPQDKIDQIISLRKKGHSYSDLQKEFKIGKATLSSFLRGIELDKNALEVLDKKRYKGKYLSIKDWADSQKWAEIKIGKINSRDKLLILSMLYWGEGTKSELNIINGDPFLLRVFLDCIRDMEIKESEIIVSLRVFNKNIQKRMVDYWSKILSVDKNSITRFEFVDGGKSDRLPLGMCRIRVKKGALYFKKIMSMITHVKSEFACIAEKTR